MATDDARDHLVGSEWMTGQEFDPTSPAAPVLATLVEATGLVIYFSIELVILRGHSLVTSRNAEKVSSLPRPIMGTAAAPRGRASNPA